MKTKIIKYPSVYLLSLALILVFQACSNRADALRELNDAPRIKSVRLQGKSTTDSLKTQTTLIQDTLKNSLKVNGRYEAILEVADVNNNLTSISLVPEGGEAKGTFFMNNVPVSVEQVIPASEALLQNNQVKIAYQPKSGELGTHAFSIVFTDALGVSAIQNFELHCISNLPPVADLNAIFTGPDPRQYQLDMSGSSDEDSSLGGMVLFYHVKVNDRPVITETLSKIPYIFNEGAGTYALTYWVTDNDGKDSEKQTLSFTVK